MSHIITYNPQSFCKINSTIFSFSFCIPIFQKFFMLLILCCLQLVVADSGSGGAAAVAAVMAVVVKKPKDVEGCDSLLSHTKVKFKIL